MLTYIIIAIILIILCAIFFIRGKYFRPTSDKEQQSADLNNMIPEHEHKTPCKTTPHMEKPCSECSKRHFEQMKACGKEDK